jgi:hypothetical protein
MFFRREYGEGLRKFTSEQRVYVSEIVDLSDLQIFDGATNYVSVFYVSIGSNDPKFDVIVPQSEKDLEYADKSELHSYQIENDDLGKDPWDVIPADVALVVDSIPEEFESLGDATQFISKGIDTSADNVFYFSKDDRENSDIEDEMFRPLLKGEDIDRYQPPRTGRSVLFPYDGDDVIPPKQMEEQYPNAWEYLQSNREQLESRTYLVKSGYRWYEFWRKREEKIYSNDKILCPEIAKENEFTLDRGNEPNYFNTKVRSTKVTEEFSLTQRQLLGILNSSLIEFIYRGISPPKRGGYRSYLTSFLTNLLVPPTAPDELGEEVAKILDAKDQLNRLNLSLLDYLGNYAEGPTLPDIGLYQPTGESILDKTTEDYEKLQIERARTTREGGRVTIEATARYKPENDDEYETDTYGYTETEFHEAFTLADLSETEAALIEAFVPVAVAEEIGGFRDNATKTNSLVDRLQAMTLPDPEATADDLERYRETKERAAELDAKIETTDRLIDEIVYDLYGLSEDEIEIVEEAVNDEKS